MTWRLGPVTAGRRASDGRATAPTLPRMSRTNFLSLVVAILFVLAAVTDLALRPDNWVALLGGSIAGAAAAMTVGIVTRRRAAAA
jgi:hypothetical protein